MISAKRLVQLAKWQRMAGPWKEEDHGIMGKAQETEECSTSVAVKGHCVMYTADGRWFEVPLAYLGTVVFSELLRMSQEEFGFTSDGRIVLPCDAAEMEYAMCLLKRNPSVEVVDALLSSMLMRCHCTESETEHHTSYHSYSNFQLKKNYQSTMISAKRLIQLAKKWQRIAALGALGRKRIMGKAQETEECSTSVAVKGHCVMYTADGRRSEVPLAYLGTAVFSELLRMSQEEFGFTSDGRIVLPFDAAEMEYAMCLLKRNPSVEVVNALLSSIPMSCHCTSRMHTYSNFQLKNKTTSSRPTMISAKRLVQMAKKWQRMAALGRKRVMAAAQETEECSTSVAVKGHCVMYTADGRRFEVPLVYLGMRVFIELLRMSQEEFGFTSDGRIVLPCDAVEMEYAMCLLKRNASADVVNALLSSMLTSCRYTASALQKKESTMISTKRIAQLAKKWRRMAAKGRKRLTMMAPQEAEGCSTTVAGKGYCIVYTADGMRFEVPLRYLGTMVFGELLRMSQEEFGFTSDGKITLPCDAMVMEYVMCLLRRNASVDVEKAFLSSMAISCHYANTTAPSLGVNMQVAICSY
uniref:Auxin-responsive protein n=1 Tax=Oryza rufipogon TaxID=4529 RepID=A0A0E0QUN2_ORYRU